MTRPVLVLALALTLTGCTRTEAPPDVRVAVGPQEVDVHPVQYCLDGTGKRYRTTAPILEVSPDSAVTLTVPADVAKQGWSVQVFDEKLVNKIGEVEVPKGKQAYTGINTSDVVPPAYYLVIVEKKGGACGSFSGAWPVGFLRAGADLGGTPSSSASSSSAAKPGG